jgi:hypothetical protein
MEDETAQTEMQPSKPRRAALLPEIAPQEPDVVEPLMIELLAADGARSLGRLARLSLRGARGLGRALAVATRLSLRGLVIVENIAWHTIAPGLRASYRGLILAARLGFRGLAVALSYVIRRAGRAIARSWRRRRVRANWRRHHGRFA